MNCLKKSAALNQISMTTSVAFPFDADRAFESHQLHESSTKSAGGDKLIHTDILHRLHGMSCVPAASQDSALSPRTLLHDLFTLILWQSLDRQQLGQQSSRYLGP